MDPNEILKQLGIDLVKDAPDLEPVEGTYEFKIYTRDHEGKGLALKTWKEKDEASDEDQMFLSGIASSTIKDLHGDTMLPSALIDMERAARGNLTIFGNHKYEVPEDVYGSVVKASIGDSGVVDGNGQPLYDLSFEKIRINRRNERAVKSWQAMDDGTKLGLSIGAKIPEGGAVRNKKTGALLIAHVELLETSVVGIPANPRSWIDAATKSFKSGPTIYPVTIDLSQAAVTVTPAPEPVSESEVEPNVTTQAPSQDAQLSQPGDDGAVATPDVIAAANDVLARTADPAVKDEVEDLLRDAHSALATVTNQLIDVDVARSAAEERAENAERERDEMRANTEEVIREVATLIDQVGKLPAGRQASFKAIQHAAETQSVDWESSGLAPEVVRMLQRGSQNVS